MFLDVCYFAQILQVYRPTQTIITKSYRQKQMDSIRTLNNDGKQSGVFNI